MQFVCVPNALRVCAWVCERLNMCSHALLYAWNISVYLRGFGVKFGDHFSVWLLPKNHPSHESAPSVIITLNRNISIIKWPHSSGPLRDLAGLCVATLLIECHTRAFHCMEDSGQNVVERGVGGPNSSMNHLFAWFSFCFVNSPNATLLVFLFPGLIVIPKPSQLAQWNSSIATIFLLLNQPCNPPPESDAALHPASIASFSFLYTPPSFLPSFPPPFPPPPLPRCHLLPGYVNCFPICVDHLLDREDWEGRNKTGVCVCGAMLDYCILCVSHALLLSLGVLKCFRISIYFLHIQRSLFTPSRHPQSVTRLHTSQQEACC